MEEIIKQIKLEVIQSKLSPEQIILDDTDILSLLKIEKRKLAELRATRQIGFSKPGGKVYYTLADVLEYALKNRSEPLR